MIKEARIDFYPGLSKLKRSIMTVRAKFKVRNIQSFSNAGSKITLTPVIADNPENKAFFDATPWGEIVLGTVNEAAPASVLLVAHTFSAPA